MSKFILTAKTNYSFSNGMRIEKGQTFEVNLPFAQLPFTSIKNKELVKQCLAREGFSDLKGHESILDGWLFDYKKV